MDDEALGEVATVKVTEEQWVMKFNGFFRVNSRGVGVILYHKGEETIALLCSNIAEYEAYLIGLAIALEIGIKHLKVIGDSNLVVYQAKGSFSLKEPSLAPYKMLAQKMEEISLYLR